MKMGKKNLIIVRQHIQIQPRAIYIPTILKIAIDLKKMSSLIQKEIVVVSDQPAIIICRMLGQESCL